MQTKSGSFWITMDLPEEHALADDVCRTQKQTYRREAEQCRMSKHPKLAKWQRVRASLVEDGKFQRKRTLRERENTLEFGWE